MRAVPKPLWYSSQQSYMASLVSKSRHSKAKNFGIQDGEECKEGIFKIQD